MSYGALDTRSLNKSLEKVVERHGALRTVIRSEAGVPYQGLLPKGQWKLSTEDRSADPSSLTREIRAFVSLPFDLGKDHMFRAALYLIGEVELVLAGVFHHISSDGWSKGILIREFMQLYSAYAKDEEIALPPLPLQYMDYALWQR